MMNTKRGGFTLMEMLLVTVLVAVISIVIFQAFSNGVKLWERASFLDNEGTLSIALDKIGDDLSASMPISGIAFKGLGMSVSFPCLVLTAADKNSTRSSEGIIDQIGAVQYRFDPGEGKLYRRQANYGQALKGEWGPDQEIASGLEEVDFHYYFPGSRGLDEKSYAEQKIPAGVGIEVRLKNDEPDHWLKRFFTIPTGGA